ncbi:MAG: hypothetical protein AAF500_18115 [Myxococcota bacterium]
MRLSRLLLIPALVLLIGCDNESPEETFIKTRCGDFCSACATDAEGCTDTCMAHAYLPPVGKESCAADYLRTRGAQIDDCETPAAGNPVQQLLDCIAEDVEVVPLVPPEQP